VETGLDEGVIQERYTFIRIGLMTTVVVQLGLARGRLIIDIYILHSSVIAEHVECNCPLIDLYEEQFSNISRAFNTCVFQRPSRARDLKNETTAPEC